MRVLSLWAVLFVFFGGGVAHAQNYITEELVEDYYQWSMEAQLGGTDESIEFLEENLHDDVVIAMNVEMHVAGLPSHKDKVSYNKNTLIEMTRKAYDQGWIEDAQSDVLSVDIAQNGQSASVSVRSYSNLVISMPMSEGKMTTHNKQTMDCRDELVLNDFGVLQTKSSFCDAEVNVEPDL